jgi:riboflavin biosynthesis pyrimidine reductase
MGGADTGQQYLRAGLVDELSIGLVPVLYGEGTRCSGTSGRTGRRKAHTELEGRLGLVGARVATRAGPTVSNTIATRNASTPSQNGPDRPPIAAPCLPRNCLRPG